MSLPREVQDALSKLKVPCEDDRRSGYVCDEEATHRTPIGALLCTEHAEKHNARIRSYGWAADKLPRYLAVPRED